MTDAPTAAPIRYGTDLGLPLVDEAVFRNVVGHFASGVTVITTQDGDVLYGTTASAVSSLSMDPPMMLICLNRSSVTHDAVVRSGRYAINILAADQGLLARHFARKGDDKFSHVSHRVSEHGLPILDGALATIECVVAETAKGGTHTVFLGRVCAAGATDGEPLAYYRGTFGQIEGGLERSAYEATRTLILRRSTPLGQEIDVPAVAAELRTDPEVVHNTLIRLAVESIVTRTEGGGFTPTPMTVDLVDGIYAARATIETGVLEAYLAQATDAQVEAIVGIGRSIADLVPVTSEDLDAFLDLNLDLHAQIVSLAGSRQLTASFRQLHIATIWRETYRAEEWQRKMGHAFLPLLIDAIVRRDATAAKAAVHEQVDFISAGAKAVIGERGPV